MVYPGDSQLPQTIGCMVDSDQCTTTDHLSRRCTTSCDTVGLPPIEIPMGIDWWDVPRSRPMGDIRHADVAHLKVDPHLEAFRNSMVIWMVADVLGFDLSLIISFLIVLWKCGVEGLYLKWSMRIWVLSETQTLPDNLHETTEAIWAFRELNENTTCIATINDFAPRRFHGKNFSCEHLK